LLILAAIGMVLAQYRSSLVNKFRYYLTAS
jgi:hypothetical protein